MSASAEKRIKSSWDRAKSRNNLLLYKASSLISSDFSLLYFCCASFKFGLEDSMYSTDYSLLRAWPRELIHSIFLFSFLLGKWALKEKYFEFWIYLGYFTIYFSSNMERFQTVSFLFKRGKRKKLIKEGEMYGPKADWNPVERKLRLLLIKVNIHRASQLGWIAER